MTLTKKTNRKKLNMKKILLALAFVSVTLANGFAQCTPDPSYTTAGIYPDTATGLADAYTGMPYSEVITVVVPTDTLVDNPIVPGTDITVDIVHIIMDSVNGLPNNFTYDCNPTNCEFPGGGNGCIVMYSTSDPVAGDIGVYPLKIYTTTNVTVPPFTIPASQVDTITSYYIEILDGSSLGLNRYNSASMVVSDVAPNPVTGISRLQVLSGVATSGKLVITNLIGEVVKSKEMRLNKGVTDFMINGSDFEAGIYLVTVASENKTVTKKIAIKK
jgi:hypothetical protein